MSSPASPTSGVLIGVISDTHGLLRPEAIEALRGVDHILHAGDVGDPLILDSLRELAPVTAISGNIDAQGPCSYLPATELVTLHGRSFYMLHDRYALDLDPVAAGFAAFRKPGRAVAAGLVIGVVEAMLGGYVSTSYNDVLLYAILFAIIILRPEVLGLGPEPA